MPLSFSSHPIPPAPAPHPFPTPVLCQRWELAGGKHNSSYWIPNPAGIWKPSSTLCSHPILLPHEKPWSLFRIPEPLQHPKVPKSHGNPPDLGGKCSSSQPSPSREFGDSQTGNFWEKTKHSWPEIPQISRCLKDQGAALALLLLIYSFRSI